MLLFWYLGGEMRQHEEVELLLKGYQDDLQEMQIELRSMLAEIEDTRKYAGTHQVIVFFLKPNVVLIFKYNLQEKNWSRHSCVFYKYGIL